MRILHWDEMFHPSFGYQINILAKFQAKQGHEVIIMSPDNIDTHPKFSSFGNKENIIEADKEYTEKHGVKIIRLPWHRVVSGRVIFKKGYIKKIIDVRADVIMCHTNDTLSAMTIARKHKKINTPIVFDNHMLEMASKNPFKKLFRLYFKTFITPLIIKNNWTVIRTQDDEYINKFLGIPKEQTPFISFGTDTSLFHPSKVKRNAFRKKHQIKKEDFVIVYTGKLDRAKGGKILAKALKKNFNTSQTVVAIIVGNYEGDYGSEVEQIFKSSENRVIRFPTQKYTDLPQFYQAADLCVFAKQCSLSFFDAQACGLPVIAENNNINIDRLSKNNGFVYKEEDVEDFREKIVDVLEMPQEQYNKISKNAYNHIRKNYDYEDISKMYTDVLIREYQRFRGEQTN